MHTCQIRLLPTEMMKPPYLDEDDCYASWLFYPGDEEIDSHPPTWKEAQSYPACGAPATKQLGTIWLCDHHYEFHEDEFEFVDPNDDEPFYPVLILEAARFEEDEDE